MKSGTLLLIASLLFLSDTQVFGQNARATRRRDAASLNRTVGDQKMAISLNLGTTGIGVEAKHILNRRWNVRFGGNFLPVAYSRDFDGSSAKAEVNFGNVHLLGELRLSPNFRFVGGVAYFFQQQIVAEGKLIDGINYGDINFKSNESSEMSVTVEWKKISPYIGIGLLRDMPVGKFNANVDIGTYYMSMPASTWTASENVDKGDLIQYKKTLDNFIAGYRWYPVLQLNLNYVVN